MKIVNREAFLAMPTGTVFSKYEPILFGNLQIKGDTINAIDGTPIDFYQQDIAEAVVSHNSGEFQDILFKSAETGCSVAMDFDHEGRDGLFEQDQLFAVWERNDILGLIERLARCVV